MPRKISAVCVIVGMILCIAGCSSETISIEGHNWNLTLIQSNEDGSVIGCASGHYEMHKEIDNIIVVDLACSASDGKLTITDDTNNTTYTGSYSLSENEQDNTIYEISLGNQIGYAVVAYTTYTDHLGSNSQTPTLIVTIGNYSLTFQAID